MKDDKKPGKKLSLKTDTVRVLTGEELGRVAGGAPPTTTAINCTATTLICAIKSKVICPPPTTAPNCTTTN